MAGNTDNSLREPEPLREKFVVPIKCKCGQVGSLTWEEKTQISPKGPEAMLISVSNGFYERIQKKNWNKTEIVCAVCEAVVPI
jgi:hypothetical protein